MYVKKCTGYVLKSTAQEERSPPIGLPIPSKELIENQTLQYPTDQIARDALNYLQLKTLEYQGCNAFLYVSELRSTTCEECASHNGEIFTLKEIESNGVSLPIHPNCVCSIVALDSDALSEYNSDKESFVNRIANDIGNRATRIYQLNDRTLVPVTSTENDNTQPWYKAFINWADKFGEDAKAVWATLLENSQRRAKDMMKGVPNFLDWLTLGAISGYFQESTGRYKDMVENWDIRSTLNWLMMGLPDTVEGALNPDEPMSFDHWLNSLSLAAGIYGGYKVVEGKRLRNPSKDPPDTLKVADKQFLNSRNKIDWTKWAPNDGYVDGTKLNGQLLKQGTIIDRYGGTNGTFTSPIGTPYEKRSLPYIKNTHAYHKYEVLKPIENVVIGEIAPAFNQIGGGIQYQLPTTIDDLLISGHLKEIE